MREIMVQSMPTEGSFGQNLVSFLLDQKQRKTDVNITISGGCYDGGMQIRGGEIVSAYAGPLSGNGAVMTLALMEGATIDSTEDNSSVAKTVYITTEQIAKLLKATQQQAVKSILGREEELLEEAKLLFFQYRYKEAGERIVAILKSNRFYYPAWLWQSRLIRRPAYIIKALDEAYRWGNHDQDIWREARKMRPQLVSNQAETSQRCFFCWSILNESSKCTYCQARLVISSRPDPVQLKSDEVKHALSLFEQAFKKDQNNARVAYSLAVGYFNLKAVNKALQYLQIAARLSPRTVAFRKGVNVLGAIIKAEKQKQLAAQASVPAGGEQKSGDDQKSILVIEDSSTSRKVLSMLFNRSGYRMFEASTGEEALGIGRVQRPNLIVLDVMLPDTTGYELLAELRAIEHLNKTPVIMLTGKTDSKSKIEGVNAGANEYLTKPFNPEKLVAIVDKYLHPEPAEKKEAVSGDLEPFADSVRPASQPIAKLSEPTPAPEAVSEDDSKNSIFVIEDSPTSRKVLSMVLSRNGFKVFEATTGQEAIALAPGIKPGLVLLDVMLPDMTGYDVLPKLRQIPYYKELPVVMLTGRKGSADRMRGIMSGTNEYLTKPFNPEKLISVIKNYI